jgi:bifunctional N6-L-threonylcarbamoyladenine synthase / protein kinase Bud32
VCEIWKGAEADLKRESAAVVKKRVQKKYRLSELDLVLRRRRTRAEAKNMRRALKAGVKTPEILSVDEENHTIRMEYVRGTLVKDIFDGESGITGLSNEIGLMLSRLHSAGIVHNDLTTSNLIKTQDGVCMIDFGLSYHTTRVEDKAMDLVVLKKSLMATHTPQAQTIWDSLITAYKPPKDILSRIDTIEKRARYK